MAKKRQSPNAALIAALQPKKPIAYDAELLAAVATRFDRQWSRMESDRLEIYRDVFPWYAAALLAAKGAKETAAVKMRADREWEQLTGLPPLTMVDHWSMIRQTAAADGFTGDQAGLRAWARRKAAAQGPVAPNDARNKFCFDEWQRGQALKEIFVSLKQRPEWEQLGAAAAIRGPIRAWAAKSGQTARDGKPGRPKRSR